MEFYKLNIDHQAENQKNDSLNPVQKEGVLQGSHKVEQIKDDCPSITPSKSLETSKNFPQHSYGSVNNEEIQKIDEKILDTHVSVFSSSPHEMTEAEKFADKVLNNLKKDQDYGPLTVDKEGRLCRIKSNKEMIPTGQREDNLKQMLMTLFKVSQDANSKILIRMKFGETEGENGLKHGGTTRFAMINLKGEIENTLEKGHVLGAGTYGKAKELTSKEGVLVVKSTYIKSEDKSYLEKAAEIDAHRDDFIYKHNNSQSIFHLNRIRKNEENSIKTIMNEVKKLEEIHKDGIIAGVQPPLKNTLMIIQGDGKSHKIKVGHLGCRFDGDANVEMNKTNWTDKKEWSLPALIKACKDLTEGLATCHQKGIYLGDIKGDNIFRDDETQKLFLGDFGGAQNREEIWKDKKYVNHIHTDDFMCPSDVSNKFRIDNAEDYAHLREKMDVFSLGVTFFKIFVKMPFTTLSEKDIISAIEKNEKYKSLAEYIAPLILDMTNSDYKLRSSSKNAYIYMEDFSELLSMLMN